MGTGYTRNDTDNNIADGNVINAADFDGEFDAIVTALSTSGHTHDGTSAEGGPVSVIGPAQDITVSATIVSPKSNNAIDLGTDALEFKDLYLDGTAYIDGLGRDLLVAGTNKIQFTNTSNYIHSASAGNVDLVAATEIHLTATTVNVDGLVDISGNLSVGGNFDVTGTIDFSDSNITNAGTIGLDSIFGDADSNTSITFSGSDVITIANAGTNQVTFNDGSIVPVTDSDVDLGTTSLRFKDTYVDSVTVTGEVAAATLDISGDIDIDGTANLDVVDIDGAVDMASTLQVDGVATFTGRDIHSGGITIANAGQIGSVGDTDAIAIASDGVVTLTQKLVGTELDISGNIDVDGTTNLDVVDIDGAVDMASTLAVTGIATFTDDIIIGDGKTIGSASDVDAIAIGADGDVTLTQDLELQHDGATISFGGNDEITVTHVHDTGLTFTNTNTGDNKPIVLQLKSEENEITANETIGSIEFAAGDDSGTDAATVAAGIHAIAEAEFTSSVNSTKLVFTTGASETAAASATAKMTLSSAGLLTIADDFMLKDGGTIGVASTNDAITISSAGIVTFKDDILIKDGGTIGVATTAGAITIASDGDTTFNANVGIGGTPNSYSGYSALTINHATNGGIIDLEKNGTVTGELFVDSNGFIIYAPVSNNDIFFKGNDDGGGQFTALQIDMSDAGTAIFNHDIKMGDLSYILLGAGNDLELVSDGTNGKIAAANGTLTLDVAGDIILDADSANWRFKDDGTSILEIGSVSSGPSFYSAVSDADMLFKGNDGGSAITALTLDMSEAGAATFNAGAIFGNANIGINESNPTARLHVDTAVAGYAGKFINDNGATDANGILIQAGTAATEYSLNVANTGGTRLLSVKGNGDVIIENSGGTLYTATAGTDNVRIGENAGDSIAASGGTAAGSDNVMVGHDAGTTVTTGNKNTLIGSLAGDALLSGHSNVAVGHFALSLEDENGYNVAIGDSSFKIQNAGVDAYNVGVGYATGFATSTGKHCTFVGGSAGAFHTTGQGNTFLGYEAGKSIDSNYLTGGFNTAVGYQAGLVLQSTVINNTLIGTHAGVAITTGNNNTFVGHTCGDALTIGTDNVAIGYAALTIDDVGSRNVAIGVNALAKQNSPGGSVNNMQNTAVGYGAGSEIVEGHSNTLIGGLAGDNITEGTLNVVIGYNNDLAAADDTASIVIGSNATGAGDNTARFQTSAGACTINIDGSDTSWAATSDQRLKKDVADCAVGLDFIKDLRPITYKWNAKNAIADTLPQYDKDSSDPVYGSGKTQHGFVAQEVKTVIDAYSGLKNGFTMWSEDPDGTQQLAPSALIPMLTKAIQELSAKNDALAARIAVLEG